MANYTNYRVSSSLLDRANQKSDFGFWITNADATAFTTDPTVATSNPNVLMNAALALTQGIEAQRVVSGRLTVTPVTAPVGNDAVRSNKLAISMRDNVTGRIFTETIPVRDSSKYTLAPMSKHLLLTTAAGGTAVTQTLVTAINAHAVSVDNNAVTVISITAVGRAVI